MRLRTQGFSIVEIIVVIIIIGILATIVTVSYSAVQSNTRDSEREAKAILIADALEKYYQENGEYPSCQALASSLNSAQSTLGGISADTLRTPTAERSTNSIECADNSWSGDSDIFAYIGDNSEECSGDSFCAQWTLRYINESSEDISSINSKNQVNTAVVPTPTLSLNSTGVNQVSLSWTPVPGTTVYRVERATSPSFSEQIQSNFTSAYGTVTGLTPGTTYWFRVYSSGSNGDSGISNVVSATTKVNPPSAPSISATVDSSEQITINWSSVSGATSYRLQYSTSSSFSSPTTINSLTGTSTTVSSLAQATTYYFRLYAINAGGTSGASNSAEATTQVDTPGTPTASASYHGPRAYSSGTWARDYNGNPSSGTFYALVANLSGSSCPSGSTRQFRARVQYNAPKTWGAWTSWVTSTSIYTPQASSPYGVRYQIQARCYVSAGNISGTSASRYACYWSGSGSTSCSGF